MERLLGGNRKKRLGEILVEAGVITPEKIEEALVTQRAQKNGDKLGTVLLDMGYIKEQQMVDALTEQLGYESINLSMVRISEEITKLADEAILRKYNLVPFGFSEKNPNVLKVAMSDPLDIRAIDNISITLS